MAIDSGNFEGDLIARFLNSSDPEDSLFNNPSQIRERSNLGANHGDRHEDASIVNVNSRGTERPDDQQAFARHPDKMDSLEAEGFDAEQLAFDESADFSPHSGIQPVHLGEIRTVQDRFHTLLKRRLQAEIQLNPPLFPWETEISEYESEALDPASSLMSYQPWLAQLRNLNLPLPVPEKVLSQLLAQCHQVVQSSLREGAKLVKVIDEMFPGYAPELNDMARLVLLGANRFPGSLPKEHLPENYEAASEKQQMLLSMLAAKQIIDALTMKVSLDQPTIERQWLTSAGLLTLEIKYQPQGSARLKVQGRLPCGANLILRSGEMETFASRANSGCLSLELFEPQPNQIYALEVDLQGVEGEQPLRFAIWIAG